MNRVKAGLESRAKHGYNCCQAVACQFCEEMGIAEETVFKMAEGFGAGMADMTGPCGALSGAVMVMSALNSTADLEKGSSKASTMKIVRELSAEFREKNGATACKDLKGVETGTMLRSCEGCIEDAIKMVEARLAK